MIWLEINTPDCGIQEAKRRKKAVLVVYGKFYFVRPEVHMTQFGAFISNLNQKLSILTNHLNLLKQKLF